MTGRIFGVVTLLLAVTLLPLEAQRFDDLEPELIGRFGGLVAAGPVLHDANFSSLPGIPSCCPGYTDGNGFGFALGGAYELPLGEKLVGIGRLLFAGYGGTLEVEEIAFVSAERDTAEATILHTIEESRTALALETMIGYTLVDRLTLVGGLRTDLFLSGSATQEERIVEPSTIRFQGTGQVVRNTYDGELPEMNGLHVSIAAGLRYELPITSDESILLAPEILVWNDFVPVVADREWSTRGLRVGLNLLFNRFVEPERQEPLVPIEQEPTIPGGT